MFGHAKANNKNDLNDLAQNQRFCCSTATFKDSESTNIEVWEVFAEVKRVWPIAKSIRKILKDPTNPQETLGIFRKSIGTPKEHFNKYV